jgi:hypothetical protein
MVATAEEGPGGTPFIEIDHRPVTLTPSSLDGLALRSAVSLSADDTNFGGFSGLLMDGPRMVAITDKGYWLLADVADGPEGLHPYRAGFAAMREEDGQPIDSGGRDAEALANREGVFAIGFERDHRIMFHIEQGKLGDVIRPEAFERLEYNAGIEALATLEDGWLIAITEAAEDGAFPVFLISHAGTIQQGRLPQLSKHSVTGADIGPDGKLYLVFRHYSPATGVSIVLRRYALDAEGFPIAASVEMLAEFGPASGIDNMEAIALWQDGAGMTHLTLLSDDNFSAFQRTLLVDFEVLSSSGE